MNMANNTTDLNTTNNLVTTSIPAPPENKLFYFDLLLMITIAVIAIIGNILVFICYWKIRSLRTVTNVFILSLSISDLLVACFSIPSSIAVLLFNVIPPQENKIEAMIYLMADMVPSILSIYALTLVALDRAIAVTKPFIHQKYVTRRKASIAVVCSWCFVFLFATMFYTMTRPAFSLFIIFMSYGIPVSIMVACYSVMGYIAQKHAKDLSSLKRTATRFREEEKSLSENNNNSPTKSIESSAVPLMVVYRENRKQSTGWISNKLKGSIRSISSNATIKSRSKSIAIGVRNLRRDFKAALTLSLILSCFVLNWTPFSSLNIMAFVCGQNKDCVSKITRDMVKYFKILHYSNSALNPILYVLLNKRWRAAFKKVLYCFNFSRRRSSQSSTFSHSEYFGW